MEVKGVLQQKRNEVNREAIHLTLLQIDQLACICAVLGSPTRTTWPHGLELAASLGIHFPPTPPARLSDIISTASPEALDLIAQMCAWNPERRPTAAKALEHPYFGGIHRPPLAGAMAAELHRRLDAASAAVTNASEEFLNCEQSTPLKRLARRSAARQRAVIKSKLKQTKV